MKNSYCAFNLTVEELKRFCADFYSVESAKVTIVKIIPSVGHRGFHVFLRTDDTTSVDFLEASFRDGPLHDSWGQRFKKE